jgi:hypothetical protein
MSGDTTLTCRDCGQAFTFTSGEQDFYASRGFSEPSRCADCRAARKHNARAADPQQLRLIVWRVFVGWRAARARDVQRYLLELRPRGARAVSTQR